jgi:hypothetical protein
MLGVALELVGGHEDDNGVGGGCRYPFKHRPGLGQMLDRVRGKNEVDRPLERFADQVALLEVEVRVPFSRAGYRLLRDIDPNRRGGPEEMVQ